MVSLLVWSRFRGPVVCFGATAPLCDGEEVSSPPREDNPVHGDRIYALCGGKTVAHLIGGSAISPRVSGSALLRQLATPAPRPRFASLPQQRRHHRVGAGCGRGQPTRCWAAMAAAWRPMRQHVRRVSCGGRNGGRMPAAARRQRAGTRPRTPPSHPHSLRVSEAGERRGDGAAGGAAWSAVAGCASASIPLRACRLRSLPWHQATSRESRAILATCSNWGKPY